MLPETASILTESWPASTVPVSHDRCFPWPPDIFSGSHGPLSSLVNFALSAPQLLAYEYPHSHTYSTAMHGDFKKVVLSKGESEKTGGDEEKEGVDWGLAGCFHSCHGDELGSYD